jgi:hypothetical protein
VGDCGRAGHVAATALEGCQVRVLSMGLWILVEHGVGQGVGQDMAGGGALARQSDTARHESMWFAWGGRGEESGGGRTETAQLCLSGPVELSCHCHHWSSLSPTTCLLLPCW